MALIKTADEQQAMRECGQLLAEIFAAVKPSILPGATTKELADTVAAEIKIRGAEAVLLGYMGFPSVVCISINSEVVHGIPGTYEIKSGDLVSLDLCIGHKGMITDSAFTLAAGDAPNEQVHRLLKATEEALCQGIDQVRPGNRVGDISQAIENHLRQFNLGVVEDLVGHGVGHTVHEPPEVPNYGKAGSGPLLKPGMTIAIEPMATLGDKAVYVASDQWTIKTADNSLSAHFEHTVLITENGYEILTL